MVGRLLNGENTHLKGKRKVGNRLIIPPTKVGLFRTIFEYSTALPKLLRLVRHSKGFVSRIMCVSFSRAAHSLSLKVRSAALIFARDLFAMATEIFPGLQVILLSMGFAPKR